MQNQGLGRRNKICAKNTPKIYLATLPIIGQNIMLEKSPYQRFIVRVTDEQMSLDIGLIYIFIWLEFL